MPAKLDHNKYYRLPWNYSDNIISWLEPTTKCNLTCEGCYREDTGDHKSLEEVRSDLEVFKRLRKSDCISIAGGDPLIHPRITDIVKMVKEMGWKPVINTNGIALNESLLKELKKAGVYGFTFHIDTGQKRPKVNAGTEVELNEVRLHYAMMLADLGDIACSFNSTITEKTLKEIPDIVNWAQKYAKIVHTMVFILYRSPALTGNFDFFANGKKIDFGSPYKESEWGGKESIYAPDVVEKIREGDPLYEPCAYLNGTANPNSFKWLLANRIVMNGKTVGYVSPRFMEMTQTFNHLFTGRYLSYAKPGLLANGKSISFLTGLIDKKMRQIFFNLLKNMLFNPINLFRSAYNQSFLIIQPINIEADGRQDMCDACPDVTVHEGKLVWSCRLEEMNQFGSFVNSVPPATEQKK